MVAVTLLAGFAPSARLWAQDGGYIVPGVSYAPAPSGADAATTDGGGSGGAPGGSGGMSGGAGGATGGGGGSSGCPPACTSNADCVGSAQGPCCINCPACGKHCWACPAGSDCRTTGCSSGLSCQDCN